MRFADLVQAVEDRSFDGLDRRYHRFRHSSHDEAVVADCVGSNLRCAHDWGWCEGIMDDPSAGRLRSPQEVVDTLLDLAAEHETDSVRVSGMEPVMEDDHLLAVADRLPADYRLRVDTNGMLLSREYLQALRRNHADLAVRLSFKGHDAASFGRLAGVEDELFRHQLRAFDALMESPVDHGLVLAGVYREQQCQRLEEQLSERCGQEVAITLEDLRLCPEIVEQCRERGIDISHVTG